MRKFLFVSIYIGEGISSKTGRQTTYGKKDKRREAGASLSQGKRTAERSIEAAAGSHFCDGGSIKLLSVYADPVCGKVESDKYRRQLCGSVIPFRQYGRICIGRGDRIYDRRDHHRRHTVLSAKQEEQIVFIQRTADIQITGRRSYETQKYFQKSIIMYPCSEPFDPATRDFYRSFADY